MGPHRRRRGFGRIAAIVLAVAVAGGALPHLVAGRASPPPAGGADAIFVLTGGENRIAEGYRAWRDGKGRNLFILGAGRDARLEQLLPALASLPAADRERVRLEGWSRNTYENAVSAKSFLAANGFRSAVLVTSDYHVPRALLAFLTVLPADVAVSVQPVRTTGKWGPASARMARVYVVEGWKYWWYRLFLLWE
ncbi:MAG: YdcF family protein [Gemmatimonadota bacterium]